MIRWLMLPMLFTGPLALANLEHPAIVGEAFSLDGGNLLYRENHYLDDGGLYRRVVYREPHGEALAVKILDYRPGLATPSFAEQDLRSGEWRMAERRDQTLLLQYRSIDRDAASHTTLEVNSPLVIDAGFDYFIRQHWTQLLSGKSLKFSFPVVSRGSLLQLSLQQTGCVATPKRLRPLDRQDLACFRITPVDWLVSWFVEPIELVYGQAERRLLVYRGLANISDRQGNGLQVEIYYDYQGASMAALGEPVSEDRVD